MVTLVELLAVLVMAAGLAGLGALVMRGQGEGWADLAVGWGGFGLALLLGDLLHLPLRPLVLLLLALGLFGLARAGRRGWPSPWLVLMLAPVVLLCAAVPVVAWDDFAHWLPNAWFLVRAEQFPQPGGPLPTSVHAGYPVGTALITYGASLPLRALGLAPLAETAVAAFAALLVGCLVQGIAARAGRPTSRWALLLGVLVVFWLNPVYAARLAFSNFGEPATAMLLGLAGLLLLRGDTPARWQAALVLAAAVNVKQTGLVLALLTLAGAALLAWWEAGPAPRGARWRAALRLAPMALPALAMWALWRPHAAAAGGAFGFRPLATWSWELAPQTLASIGVALLHKPGAILAAMALLALASTVLLRGRRGMAERLALLTVPLLLGWPSFLFLTYLGSGFVEWEIVGAAAFWRYLTQVCGLVLAALLLWLLARPVPAVMAAQAGRRWAWALACTALLLLSAAQFSAVGRFKREWNVRLRDGLAPAAAKVEPGQRLAILNPSSFGYSTVVAQYAMQLHATVLLPQDSIQMLPLAEATLRQELAMLRPDILLLLSTDAATETVLATPALPSEHWRLLRRDGTGWATAAEGAVAR